MRQRTTLVILLFLLFGLTLGTALYFGQSHLHEDQVGELDLISGTGNASLESQEKSNLSPESALTKEQKLAAAEISSEPAKTGKKSRTLSSLKKTLGSLPSIEDNDIPSLEIQRHTWFVRRGNTLQTTTDIWDKVLDESQWDSMFDGVKFSLVNSDGAYALQIGEIEKESLLDRAGFKSNDVIQKIDGSPIVEPNKTLERLRNSVKRNLTLIVKRDGKELTKRIAIRDPASIETVEE